MAIADLPAVNAALNSTAAVLLLAGYRFIRRREVLPHRICMSAAFLVSGLFLTSYTIYHYSVGSVPFRGTGWLRTVYFSVLIPHVLLAGIILPLAIFTLSLALRGKFDAHRRIARWTLPLWLYVSVSGVVVYWMLYQL